MLSIRSRDGISQGKDSMTKKQPLPRGRQTTYTQEVAEQICERIANGEPLRQICRDEGMPAWRTAYDWQTAHPEFAARIAHARELGEEAIAQECMMIADTPKIGTKTTSKATGMETVEADMIEHRRLQIDTRLKLLAKWNPRKWGDKLALGGASDLPAIETQATLNVTSLSTEALAEIMAAKDAAQRG
jgi:hypothetical protein